jgi:hypothetical protein
MQLVGMAGLERHQVLPAQRIQVTAEKAVA